MFGEAETLIVVYKDELLLNLFKKKIETNDDRENEIVGIEDGTVKIVAWDEKVWEDQKKAGNINNKVLFLGKVNGWNKLLPVIDVKYKEYGITFGFAGKQALLVADVTGLDDPKLYNEFLDKLNTYDIPDMIKSEHVDIIEEEPATEGKKTPVFFSKVGGFVKSTIKKVSDNVSKDQRKKLKQQYFYGVQKLYEEHLAGFLG